MSASQRSLQPSRAQGMRKKSKDFRESLSLGETFHRVTRWYPSISEMPDEAIVLTMNGSTSVQGGTKSRPDSRLGVSSVNEFSEPSEPVLRVETKPERHNPKLLQANMKE